MDVGVIERNPEEPSGRPASFLSPRAPGADERAAADRLDEIRQYLRDQYARRDVVTRTRTSEGDEVDWVPVESQADVALAEPPGEEDLPGADPERPSAAAPLAPLSPQAEQAPPPGTVPLVRKRVEDLRPVGILQDWLAKGPRRREVPPPDNPIPPATGAAHKYAHAYQQVTCYGTEGYINTWKPYVQWSNEFSLGQLWLVRGSGSGLQTLEVGAQTYKDLYGDWSPHLFIFYTTNKYMQMGDNLGGYNTDVGGWVQVGTKSFPGMRVAESVQAGSQYDLLVRVQLYEGNWWVRIGSEWMGYYPGSLYNDAGMRSQADRIDWGGEIVDDSVTHPEPTSTHMGSGAFPAAGWTQSAYMRNLTYQSDTAGSLAPVQAVPSVTNPTAYDIATDFTGTSGWGSHFWFGGPGGV